MSEKFPALQIFNLIKDLNDIMNPVNTSRHLDDAKYTSHNPEFWKRPGKKTSNSMIETRNIFHTKELFELLISSGINVVSLEIVLVIRKKDTRVI